MSIQYFGRGPDDDKPDRYMPHCDGDCNGLDFKPGNRMATMVMYCDIPIVGGATNFRNSGVHVKPTKYAATFFSYIDPVTMKMDDGFTEHSGCPVIEGEKKIVTQWVRLGVDDQNPWSSFNTCELVSYNSFCCFSVFIQSDLNAELHVVLTNALRPFVHRSGHQVFGRSQSVSFGAMLPT